MGGEDGRADQARGHPLGGRLAGRVRRPVRPDGGKRHLHQAERGAVAGLLLRPLRRQRRRPRGGPHLHLLALEGRRRPHQQLGKPVRDAQEAEGALQRLHARAAPCTCCPSAWVRSARPCRRSASNSPIRRTWWSTCASWRASACRSSRKSTRTRSAWCRACTAWALPLAPGRRDVPWPCNPGKVHRPLPGNPRNLVLRLGLRRQRAARQEVLRAAHRLQHRAR